MHPLPHRYIVSASLAEGHDIALTTDDAPPLRTAAPREFDGPGGRWSPETLLVGAVADCFAITFRGSARASKLAWDSFACRVDGTLDRVDGAMRFTHIDIYVQLGLPETVGRDLAHRLLEKVKRNCLITNSLNAEIRLHAIIETGVRDSVPG